MEVRSLRGQMVPTRKNRPVTFDDVNSFVTRIGSAEIAINVKTLSDLLNRRVFAYPGASLKNISVTVDRGRLHVDKIAAAHLPVKGLLHFFGEDLAKLIKLKQDRGVTVEGDSILLHPDRMLPPPRIEGKVAAVRALRKI